MKLSIHETKGKAVVGSGVDLGHNWMNIEASWPEVFELITVDGVATSAELKGDWRVNSQFVSRELVMIDIDDGMTIMDLLNDSFYNKWGAGFYATPSFTPEHHKFRICFRLPEPETDYSKLRLIVRGLLMMYEHADQACKDPVRLFYGTPNCTVKEITSRVLDKESCELLAEAARMTDKQLSDDMQSADKDYTPLNNDQKKRIVDLLQATYVGEWHLWRNVAWGLKEGGFTLADFQYVTRGMMNQKSPEDAKKMWESGKAGGGITMGSVYHLLKQRHPTEPLSVGSAEHKHSNFIRPTIGQTIKQRI